MEQIAADIYRTENLEINNTPYTVRFSATRDGIEHILFVSNNSNGKQRKYHIAKPVAEDFQAQNGSCLVDNVFELIKGHLSEGLI